MKGNVGLGQTEIRWEQESGMIARKDVKRSRGKGKLIQYRRKVPHPRVLG